MLIYSGGKKKTAHRTPGTQTHTSTLGQNIGRYRPHRQAHTHIGRLMRAEVLWSLT